MKISFKRVAMGVMMGTSVLTASMFATLASAEEVKGKETLILSHIHATQPNGTAFPEHDADCKRELALSTSKFTDLSVTTDYSIDATSLIMSAHSTFAAPDTSKGGQVKVGLSALGVAENYSFGAFKPAELPNAYVIFSIEKDFKNAVSSILVLNQNKPYNCAISSSASGANLAAVKSLDTKKDQ